MLLNKKIGIDAAAWGTVLGSFLWFIIQLFGAAYSNFRYRFVLPKFDKITDFSPIAKSSKKNLKFSKLLNEPVILSTNASENELKLT